MRKGNSGRKAGGRAGRKPPLIRLVGVEALAVAAAVGLAGAPAHSAPGDLDPLFGDVGRSNLPHYGTLWSVDVQDDDSLVYGGEAYYYCYFSCYEDYFLGRLLPDGTPESAFSAAHVLDMVVHDTALQPDGRIVAVGTRASNLKVTRLLPNGTLDLAFDGDGVAVVTNGAGYSVLIDPDGRIVVAGSSGGALVVARLLPDGTPDAGFGSGGIFLGPATGGYRPQLALAPDGGYRVTAHPNDATSGRASCVVVALTSAGELQSSFGQSGLATATVPAGSQSTGCSDFVVLPDGRIVLGGAGLTDFQSTGYVTRMASDGTPDLSFDPQPLAARLKSVTALAVGATGSVFVAGNEQASGPGALVLRLLADGRVDPAYGVAGEARLDLKAERSFGTSINDMKSVENGGLVVGGSNNWYPNTAFVAKLMGDDAGGGPGVLSMVGWNPAGTEEAGRAVARVRRSGGSVGAVSVNFSTRPSSALAGRDFEPTTGRLDWADGDSGEREITVPLIADEAPEFAELFSVVLDTPTGGAGLGTYGADVQIESDSPPAGFLTIHRDLDGAVREGGVAQFSVRRNVSATGAVSVTVRLASDGTATPGVDFRTEAAAGAWQDVELLWADGDQSDKTVSVLINQDDSKEGTESFTLELAAPTGGVALGEPSKVAAVIADPPTDFNGGGGGGGRFGWAGALLLGLAGWLRRRSMPHR